MGHGVVTSALMKYLSLVVMVLVFNQTLAHLADWYETLPYEDMGTPKMTRLNFYLHYIVTGNNASAVLVAQPLSINPSPTRFGSVYIADNRLTRGPELNSDLVGRAQGIFAYTGQEERVLIMAASFVFTDEKFNGSTLSILARIPQMNPVREYPVVGGTGAFRFARGYAIARVYSFNETTQNAIIKYDIIVIHY